MSEKCQSRPIPAQHPRQQKPSETGRLIQMELTFRDGASLRMELVVHADAGRLDCEITERVGDCGIINHANEIPDVRITRVKPRIQILGLRGPTIDHSAFYSCSEHPACLDLRRRHRFTDYRGRVPSLSLIHISEPTRQAEISYAVFCLK